MEPEVLERINRGIILRTGAYLTNDHFVISTGRHAREYVEKRLITAEPAFTEGLGDIIAKHFAQESIDMILTTGVGASILGHCVARAHPSRPRLLFAIKDPREGEENEITLPREFAAFLYEGCRALIVEDMLTTGSTIQALIRLVKERGGMVVGIGTLWNRCPGPQFGIPLFALVTRDFPTYRRDECPLCQRGVPLNAEVGGGASPPVPRRARGVTKQSRRTRKKTRRG